MLNSLRFVMKTDSKVVVVEEESRARGKET